ncbi:urea ABC transporter permease subunit UrtC [Lusitaniella coriacea LEGE 07157]|uniref:Urea ABC transporter permease subunit UrtC n=1 Tax=Lusitaniella coriacea LEGE 07157 TaxID=945747 RepID=A0A8J7DYA9_9CYAN|nr:urea ABC transporter permease subunit UrtC [Lusitaniella coriacea]MBE9117477.1 urea ABC transporter permease subunit UrtC [Lusitaniella coriacea LEGE 07157]
MTEQAAPVQSTRKKKRQKLKREIIAIAVLGIILAVAMPAILYALNIGFRLKFLGRFLSLAIIALGIDLIWGYTGLLSLGHGIFFALGGYSLAMHLKVQDGELPDFMTQYGVDQLPWFWEPYQSFPFTLIAIVVLPMAVAGILGYLVFRNRIRGVYFSILTQAALLVFYYFFKGPIELFNGTNGLKTDSDTLFGAVVSSQSVQFVFYEVTVLLLIAAYLLCRWLTSGRFGRLLIAIRDDENRVRFSGYDPTGFKVVVFAISGALAGIAGALYSVQTGIVTPDNTMEVAFSIEMVIWVAVGGRGTLVGAILGAVLVSLARTLLSEKFPDFWLFFQGGLFLLVVTVLPDGIVGWFRGGGINRARSLFGFPKPVFTYPSLEEDPEVQKEREVFEETETR